MMKNIPSILIISLILLSLLFPYNKTLAQENGHIVLYPAYIEIENTTPPEFYSYIIENKTGSEISFAPKVLSFFQNESLNYIFNEVSDKKILNQIKFDKNEYTLKPNTKTEVRFRFNPLDSESKPQYLAISNVVNTNKKEISIGETLTLLLFIEDNKFTTNILGNTITDPSVILKIIKFEPQNNTVLVPQNTYEIVLQNVSEVSIKPVIALELYDSNNSLISKQKISDDGIRLLPNSIFKNTVDVDSGWKFYLLPLPQKITAKLIVNDTSGLSLLTQETSYYYLPIFQIIFYIILTIGGILLLKKIIIPARKPGSVA